MMLRRRLRFDRLLVPAVALAEGLVAATADNAQQVGFRTALELADLFRVGDGAETTAAAGVP